MALLGALFGGFGTKLLERRTARESADAKLRDELWKELGNLREQVGQLSEKVDRLNGELLAERETSGRLRVELAAVTARAERAERERDEAVAELEALRGAVAN